jgi:hypothetical protein
MAFIGRNVFLCLCLLLLSQGWQSYGQQQPLPPQPSPPQPAEQKTTEAKPAPPAEKKATEKKRVRPAGLPDSSDGQFSFAPLYWIGRTHPLMRTGRAAAEGVSSDLDFPGKNKPALGGVLSFPAGGEDTLRVSYFRSQGQGNTWVAGKDLSFLGVAFSTGDYLSVGYLLQNAKVSLDYVSWPGPGRTGSFRLKTLWEVQYTSFRSTFYAPFKPTEDSSGNAVETFSTINNWFVYPSFGLGIEKAFSQHFRWEVKASGFAIPHFPTVGDAETFFAYRAGHFEVLFGARAFHFKTSPKHEEYVRATVPGAYAAIRWYPKRHD